MLAAQPLLSRIAGAEENTGYLQGRLYKTLKIGMVKVEGSWADKFREHGNGVFLGPIANSRWTWQLMAAADFVWLCSDFAFTHPTHAGKRSSMPLFMAAMGDVAAAGLHRLATTTSHRGVLYGRPWWHSCGTP